jgi:energy-coupling factor transporter ATP-binding protein EcfA2
LSIEEQIVEWAATRASWQRVVLRRIAHGEQISDDDIAGIADGILNDTWTDNEVFSLTDMPVSASTGRTVRLLEIGNVQFVNALQQDLPLKFEPNGLTIVYGDNASGKSGYARLIKRMVRARHVEPILTDVFTDSGRSTPQATVVMQVADELLGFVWPAESPDEVVQVGFLDKACGDAYVTTESDISYRPAALFVLDGLIETCDRLRSEIDRRLTQNISTRRALPTLAPGTSAARFLGSFSASTSDEAIENTLTIPTDLNVQIAQLAAEEARLRASDPTQEKKRLAETSAKFVNLGAHDRECEMQLGDLVVQSARKSKEQLAIRERAAELASEESFEDEPLPGIGGSVWRAMWEAARAFAAESCPDHSFPPEGPDSKCVLCQQALGEEASTRLRRFEDFVRNVTQRELAAATREWNQILEQIQKFDPQPVDVIRPLESVADDYPEFVHHYRRAIEQFSARKEELLVVVAELEDWRDLTNPVPVSLMKRAEELATALQMSADAVDDSSFANQLVSVTRDRTELEATKLLNLAAESVRSEALRLRAKAKLDQVKEAADTRGISRKSADLTRDYVTSVIRDRFTRESDRLRLERVTLEDIGGRKGTLHHQPAFVGAVQEVEMTRVLSEGEQTALGLAGFFTEAYFDTSKSAIVLDDPVSSLDHVRRGYVAYRLVEFAKERQVIVFTHDIAFVADLRASADREVPVHERSIERRISGQPGVCLPNHPWKARDVGQRLQLLAEELARIRRDRSGWDQESYERETAEWAGKMSETWERMINLEVVGQVVDRGTQEVRPRMFRLLAKITEDDDREFQSSYSRCSRWARRHDKSIESNYVPPTIEEMEPELQNVRVWWNRVKSYKNG